MKKNFIIAGVLLGLIGLSLPLAKVGFEQKEAKQAYADSSDFEIYTYNTSTQGYTTLFSSESITDFSSAVSWINSQFATGAKIVLLRDITIPGNHWLTRNYTIDLNGHNITVNDNTKSFVLGYRDGMAKSTQVRFNIIGSGTITGNVKDSVLLLDGTGSDHSYSGNDLCLITTNIENGVHIKHTGSSGRGVFVNEGASLTCKAGSYIESTTSYGLFAAGGSCGVYGRVEGSGGTSIYDIYEGNTSANGWYGSVVIKGDSADVDNVFISNSNCRIALGTAANEYYTNLNPIKIVWSSAISHADTWYPLSYVSSTFKNNFSSYITLEFQYSQHYTLSWVTNSTAYGQIKATIKNYTITYNANGGTGTGVTDTVKALNTYTVRENMFSHSGYVSFKHWNTSPDDTGTWYDGNEFIDDGVMSSMVLYAIWEKYDHNYYDEFSIEYLHMNDYDSSLTGEGDGSCATYYALAKDYFENTLNKNQRVNMATYLNGTYANAWARFNEWARINGETISLENGDYVISSNRSINPISVSSSNAATIVIISSVCCILMASAVLVTLKMKKKHE